MTDRIFGEKIRGIAYRDRPGAYLIAVRNGKLAVAETPKGYQLLGGGLEPGESHQDCIYRECLEEIGCGALVEAYICSAQMYRHNEKNGYYHPIQYYYTGMLLARSAIPVEKDHRLVWLPVQGIEQRMHLPAQAWAVKYYLKERGLA